MGNFEAAAGGLEAQGVAPTHLREYHRKWLRLSPGRAAQLKRIAADCMQELRRAGVVADNNMPGWRPVPDAGARGAKLVAAAVDSLAAEIGPADFAYLDSMVRRYMSSLATRQEASASAVSSAGGALNVRSLNVAVSCLDCPVPDMEYISGDNTQSGTWTSGGYPLIGGLFKPTVLPQANYLARTVTELLSGNGAFSIDTCHFNGSQMDTLELSGEATWVLGAGGTYASNWDMVLISWEWAHYYAQQIAIGNAGQGCGSYSHQDLYIGDCWAENPLFYQYAFGGVIGKFVYYDGEDWAVEAYRENGNGDVFAYQYF